MPYSSYRGLIWMKSCTKTSHELTRECGICLFFILATCIYDSRSDSEPISGYATTVRRLGWKSCGFLNHLSAYAHITVIINPCSPKKMNEAASCLKSSHFKKFTGRNTELIISKIKNLAKFNANQSKLFALVNNSHLHSTNFYSFEDICPS